MDFLFKFEIYLKTYETINNRFKQQNGHLNVHSSHSDFAHSD